MSSQNNLSTNLSGVTYNAARARFEALVTLKDDSGRYTYDCDIEAPLNTPAPIVATALVHKARKRHAPDQPGMRMQRIAEVPQRLSGMKGPSLVATLLGNFEALFGHRAA